MTMNPAAESSPISRFFAWWRGELAHFVPDAWRRWWRGDNREILARLEPTRVVLMRPDGDTLREWASADGDDLPTLRAEVDKRLAAGETSGSRFLVLVDAGQMLVRRITLPLAVEENLRQALSFEIDRLTPFKPDHVRFDYRVLARDAATRQITLELAVIKRTVVDEAIARAHALGIPASSAASVGESGHCMRFGGDAVQAVSTGRSGPRAALAALTAGLLVTWIALPIWQKREAAVALQTPLAEAKAAAAEAASQRDALDKAVAEANWLPERKWQRPSTLRVVDELTRQLGNDTFATLLEFDANGVQVQGESATATGLVELLEKSPMFKDVAFKAQLTKIQGTANDRFHVAAAFEDGARHDPAPAPPATPAAAADASTKPAPGDAPAGNEARS